VAAARFAINRRLVSSAVNSRHCTPSRNTGALSKRGLDIAALAGFRIGIVTEAIFESE
jgi:hypothetical protein